MHAIELRSNSLDLRDLRCPVCAIILGDLAKDKMINS